MCDEYDDERMRLFWRKLAENEDLVVLPTETVDVPVEPIVRPLGAEAEKAKARPKALAR